MQKHRYKRVKIYCNFRSKLVNIFPPRELIFLVLIILFIYKTNNVLHYIIYTNYKVLTSFAKDH